MRVREGEGVGDLHGQLERAVERERAVRGEQLLQVRRPREFEHDERPPAVGAAVEDGDDVLVPERRADDGFAPEARKAHGVHDHPCVQDLHRDHPLELAVERLEDDRHAARPDNLVEPVAPGETLSDYDCRVLRRRERMGRHEVVFEVPPGVPCESSPAVVCGCDGLGR